MWVLLLMLLSNMLLLLMCLQATKSLSLYNIPRWMTFIMTTLYRYTLNFEPHGQTFERLTSFDALTTSQPDYSWDIHNINTWCFPAFDDQEPSSSQSIVDNKPVKTLMRKIPQLFLKCWRSYGRILLVKCMSDFNILCNVKF